MTAPTKLYIETLREMFAQAANERRMKEADAIAAAIAALAPPSGEAVCHRWLRNGEVTSKWTDGVPSARALESAKECSKNAATWVVQYAYASPTATVDVGALRELVEKWRGSARGGSQYSTTEYEDGCTAELRRCADELAALIGGEA